MKRRPTQVKAHKRRAIISFEHSQTGDVATNDVAGRDIYHGVSTHQVVDMLQESLSDEKHNRMMVVTALEQIRQKIAREGEYIVRMIVLSSIFLAVLVVALVLILTLVLVSL